MFECTIINIDIQLSAECSVKSESLQNQEEEKE